jgi:hypothetical protein
MGKSANGQIRKSQNSNRKVPFCYLLFAVLLLAAAAYWGPWVDHDAAALKLSGQDMGEFVKFIPEISARQVRFPRQLFYLPPFVCAICMVLLAANRHLVYPRWLRVGMLGLAVILLPGLLPPVWSHPKEWFATEYRLQGIALALGAMTIMAHGLFRNVSTPTLALILGVLALTGLVPVQWAFWAIKPRVWAVYDTPTIRLGWGLWLGIAAWVGLAISSVATWVIARTSQEAT